jgi:hypothetical protein
MLADQRLSHPQRPDQLMHTPTRLQQLQHNRDPHWRGQRAQQLTGGNQSARRPRRAGRR